jgi:precorrin-6A/cobalt-precorrin-6A reductase
MIALILGTSEGKEILRKLNKFTEELVVTTATSYGGELLKEFKYRYMNNSPLSKDEMKKLFMEYKCTALIDASHPYALEVTANAKVICRESGIEYMRYERPSVVEAYLKYDNVMLVGNLQQIKDEITARGIQGALLNTTGSKNVERFMELNIPNRIIHRVLPTVESIDKCLKAGVKVEDLAAIKGPVGLELNKAFIREYAAEVMVLKDSGTAGGTEEKLKSAVEEDILAFVLKREESDDSLGSFKSIDELITYIERKV